MKRLIQSKIQLKESFQSNKFLSLSKKIDKLYPYINEGGCAVISKAIHKVTNYPYVLLFDNNLLENDPPIHVMIKLPNNKLFDSNGIRSEDEIEKHYASEYIENDEEYDFSFVEDNGELLNIYYNKLDGYNEYEKDYLKILNLVKNTL